MLRTHAGGVKFNHMKTFTIIVTLLFLGTFNRLAADPSDATRIGNAARIDIKIYELVMQERYDELRFQLQDELQRTLMVSHGIVTDQKRNSLDKLTAIETLQFISLTLSIYPVPEAHPAFESIHIMLNSIPDAEKIISENDGTIKDYDIKRFRSNLTNSCFGRCSTAPQN